MNVTNAEAVQPQAAAQATIWDWARSFPLRLQTFTAVATVAAAIIYLPQPFIPEPLSLLRDAGPGFVLLAIFFTWGLRGRLSRNLPAVVFATTIVLTALILVHLVFVKPVHYRTTVGDKVDIQTVWFITGWRVADPALANMTAEDQIRIAGSGPDELRAIWGSTYTTMAGVYAVLYVLAINGLVFSIGGTDLAQSRLFGVEKRTPAPLKGAPGQGGKKRSQARKS